jgi:hypothetical protein
MVSSRPRRRIDLEGISPAPALGRKAARTDTRFPDGSLTWNFCANTTFSSLGPYDGGVDPRGGPRFARRPDDRRLRAARGQYGGTLGTNTSPSLYGGGLATIRIEVGRLLAKQLR